MCHCYFMPKSPRQGITLGKIPIGTQGSVPQYILNHDPDPDLRPGSCWGRKVAVVTRWGRELAGKNPIQVRQDPKHMLYGPIGLYFQNINSKVESLRISR